MPDPPAATTVLANRRLADAAYELRLARPTGFAFAAGQRLRVHRGADRRDYSIASAPGEADLAICVRRFPHGRVSPELTAVKAGASLTISGPFGYFRYQPEKVPAVFVATGTGIAPFRAMAGAGQRPSLVLHGVRSLAETYYREDFERAGIDYRACFSRAPQPPADPFFDGRVTEFLARRLGPGAYDFYLCGRREMVRDATWIIDERFAGARILSEVFF